MMKEGQWVCWKEKQKDWLMVHRRRKMLEKLLGKQLVMMKARWWAKQSRDLPKKVKSTETKLDSD